MYIRKDEHGGKPDQPIHRHLRICSYFQELSPPHSLPRDSEIGGIDLKEHLINAVLNNCGILNQNNN